jgi:hypothetical protein
MTGLAGKWLPAGILSDRSSGCQRRVSRGLAARIMAGMFIVAWEGTPPPDKAEWIAILREVLEGEVGSYRVVFKRGAKGWRFTLDWREGEPAGDVIANSPESVAYNIYVNLAGGGKPIDATWKPGTAREAP